jgi:hypothetical protein
MVKLILALMFFVIVFGAFLIWHINYAPCPEGEHRESQEIPRVCLPDCVIPTGINNITEYTSTRTCENGAWVGK